MTKGIILKQDKRFYSVFDGWNHLAVSMLGALWPLHAVQMDELLTQSGSVGRRLRALPLYIAEEDGVILIWPTPDKDYKVVAV